MLQHRKIVKLGRQKICPLFVCCLQLQCNYCILIVSISQRTIKGGDDKKPYLILVESRSWRDRNLNFGPNCDLEVDNLEKNKKFGEAKPSQIFYFFPNYPPPDHNLWAKC